jgi:hypothetical protein
MSISRLRCFLCEMEYGLLRQMARDYIAYSVVGILGSPDDNGSCTVVELNYNSLDFIEFIR